MIKKLCLLWLLFLSSFLLGMSIYDLEIWPHQVFLDAKQFIIGGQAEDLSLLEKITNDFNIKPIRHIKAYATSEKTGKISYKELKGLHLNPRRENPSLFLSSKAPAGYRVIFGIFDFEKSLHGAIILDPDGHISHIWHISQDGLEWKHDNDTNIFPHGFEIAPDGSIVVAFDEGESLIKYDFNSNIIWCKKGIFHHSINFEGKDAIWCLQNTDESFSTDTHLVKVDYNTGAVLKRISFGKIVEKNPEIDIFGIRQIDTYEGSTWAHDKWHPNDIEPLPKSYEKAFPTFSAGDLLGSMRSIDLVFVLDQNSLKVKWWRQGLTRRQHDPDWNENGTISIFNNNMHREYSQIVELNPVTYKSRILIDGRNYDFYTWFRGKHQLTDGGSVLITSADQGRIFEVDIDGNTIFEFINTYNENHETLALSEARFLPLDYFKEGLL